MRADLQARRGTEHSGCGDQSRQQTLLAGDLNDEHALSKVQGAVDGAVSALAGIDDAVAVLTQQKTEADAQLAAERDRIDREAAAEALAVQVAAIEAALPLYLEHSRALAEALSAVAHFHFESDQMAQFIQSGMSQIEIAANFVLVELKAMPAAIRESRQSITPAKPAPAPVAAADPAPPTQTVFMMRSARYRDHDGRKRFAGQFEDAIMPVATAQKAMRLGLAVPTTESRRATLRGARGGDFRADAPDVVDIDTAEKHSGVAFVGPDANDPVLRAANITVIDRGVPERKGTIPVHRI